MNNGDRNDDGVDNIARDVHAHALEALSPRTLAQLQVRRRGVRARSVGMPLRGVAWPVAAAGAIAALAIGWQLQRPDAPPASVSVAASSAIVDEGDSPTLALDENPDLFEWLASGDAQTLAME